MIDFQNLTPKILVIGDLIVDHYLWGSCDRISPEAPVQIVAIESESTILGGAGNVVNNLKALGAEVDLMSVIGECEVSNELFRLISDINVSTQHLITENNRISSKKSRIIAAQQQVIRYDRECIDEISHESEQKIISLFRSIVINYDVILLSDYGKGLLTFDLTQSIISISSEFNKKLLVDPKGTDYLKYKGAYLLTPNKKEASEATNISIKDNKSIESAIKELKKRCDLKLSLITLSDQGVAIFDTEFRIHPTVAIEVFDVTGAGDTILASLGFAISCNKDIDEAVKFANLASGVVVAKIGSATASLDEINEYQSNLNNESANKAIKTWNEINTKVTQLKEQNNRIIFTNGCFDILHTGHIKYLEKAKSFGDKLIVGLNSDKSIQKIKGINRPINTQADRAYILASIEFVDYVVIFEDKTPLKLIELITPDVLVKGGDYKDKYVVGQEIANELKIVNFIEGKSTTKTIKQIKEL
jgi:D-beta-D-heptose 7-phosphate kinase / D-beta-D-heptose 1-phosphate adenosyltransferase